MPVIDIRTVVLMLLLSAVLMTVVLLLGTHGGRGNGLARWTTGLAFIALAWFLIAARDTLPPLLTVVTADAVMLAGLVVQVGALLEFGGHRPHPFLLAPVLFLGLLPIRDDFAAYTLVASLTFALPMSALAVFSWRLGQGGSRILMALFYALGAVLLTMRAILLWAAAPAESNFFTTDALQSATFLTLFAMTITGSFGFLEMLRKNDTYGHSVGDQVLAAVADATRTCLRREDVLGRYGGEEFCALLPATDVEHGLAAAERIRAAIESLVIAAPATHVTVSVGVALCHDPDEDAIERSLRRADEALYEAKNAGRNRVAIDSPDPEHVNP